MNNSLVCPADDLSIYGYQNALILNKEISHFVIVVQFKTNEINYFFDIMMEYLMDRVETPLISILLMPLFPHSLFCEVKEISESLQFFKEKFPSLSLNPMTIEANSYRYFIGNLLRFQHFCPGTIVQVLGSNNEIGFVHKIDCSKYEADIIIPPRIDYDQLNSRGLCSQRALNQVLGDNYNPPFNFFDEDKLIKMGCLIHKDNEQYKSWDGKTYLNQSQIIQAHIGSIKSTNIVLTPSYSNALRLHFKEFGYDQSVLNDYLTVEKMPTTTRAFSYPNQKSLKVKIQSLSQKVDTSVPSDDKKVVVRTDADVMQESEPKYFEVYRVFDLVHVKGNGEGSIIKIENGRYSIILLNNTEVIKDYREISLINTTGSCPLSSTNNPIIPGDDVISIDGKPATSRTVFSKFVLVEFGHFEIKWVLSSQLEHKDKRSLVEKKLIGCKIREIVASEFTEPHVITKINTSGKIFIGEKKVSIKDHGKIWYFEDEIGYKQNAKSFRNK